MDSETKPLSSEASPAPHYKRAVMRVTFDTNTLDLVSRPERHTRGPDYLHGRKVNQALKAGTLSGFFSETLVTLEGIEKKDRLRVLATTRLSPLPLVFRTAPDGVQVVEMTTVTTQERNPLHPKHQA